MAKGNEVQFLNAALWNAGLDEIMYMKVDGKQVFIDNKLSASDFASLRCESMSALI